MAPRFMDVDEMNATDFSLYPPKLTQYTNAAIRFGSLEESGPSIFNNPRPFNYETQHKDDTHLTRLGEAILSYAGFVDLQDEPGLLSIDSDKISASHFPLLHERPASPPLTTPSLSPPRSEVSSSIASTSRPNSTGLDVYDLRLPEYRPLSSSVTSLDERKDREKLTRPRRTWPAKEAQCRRFPVDQTRELEAWLTSHSLDPYPDREEKERLATRTGLSVRQVSAWFSRARSRKVALNSPFPKRLPSATSVPREPPIRSLLHRKSLIIDGEGKTVIPQGTSITFEQKSSESSGAGNRVAPPNLSALVNAVVLVQRLNRTRLTKLDETDISPANAQPAVESRPSLSDTLKIPPRGGIDMELWLSRSQETLSSSPETDSVNSFEDDSPDDSSEDEGRNPTTGCWYTSKGLSTENMLLMLHPLFANLPDEISLPLSHDLTLLFDSWAVCGGLDRPSQPSSSSPSTPPRNQANGSSRSSTEHCSSSGSGKKRPLHDGSESPGDADDKNGDESRKRPMFNSQRREDIALRWSCPFYQRSPHHYCVETEYGDYRKCAKSPGFSGVHRVKDHIYKCHASIYCDRCYSLFKNEDDLTMHRRDPSPCAVQDPRPMPGLTSDQKKLLKPRDRNKSEEERWKTIYKICFPNDEFIPSPYYIYYSRETAELRRDVLDIVEEETRSLDDTVRDRIRERLQHAFNNVRMRCSLGNVGLPTPSSSEISSQQSWEAGPSPRSPLASRSAAVTSSNHQTIPAVTVPTQDPLVGELQGYDANDQDFFDFSSWNTPPW